MSRVPGVTVVEKLPWQSMDALHDLLKVEPR